MTATLTTEEARADRWRATFAHVRAVLVAAVCLVLAVLARRPDLVVLGTPFVAVAAWSALTRPERTPRRWLTGPSGTLTEGRWAHLAARVERVRHTELLALAAPPAPFVQTRPPSGASVELVTDPGAGASRPLTIALPLRPVRWGRRVVGPFRVAATSPWAAFRWGPVVLGRPRLLVAPDPETFDLTAAAPHPRGLVGAHRSTRPGDGSEFASIRPFQWGDRLRRVHWGRSLRSGELHVTSSHADQDTHVAVLVDAHYDLGASGGVDGTPSTLDHTVRAAAALGEHFLRQGDRVSLHVLSGRTPGHLRPATGRRHGRRLLAALGQVVAAPQAGLDPRRLRHHLPPGTLVVVLSALVSPDVLTQAAVLAHGGRSVVLVDTMVADVAPPGEPDAAAELAWRIRLLERERGVRAIRAEGVPVVPWRGPGSLDQVLRSMARRRA